MIPSDIKNLCEKYCMGLKPTKAQQDEIIKAVKAAGLDAASRSEVNAYMLELMAGPTKEQKLAAEAEAKRKAEEDARRKAKEEAERKAKEEAERKAQAEAERKAQEEADRKAKEDAEKAKQEAERRAKEREEAEKRARAEAERQRELQKIEDERKKREQEKNARDLRRKERRAQLLVYSTFVCAILLFSYIELQEINKFSSIWTILLDIGFLIGIITYAKNVRKEKKEYPSLWSKSINDLNKVAWSILFNVILCSILPLLYFCDPYDAIVLSPWLVVPTEAAMLMLLLALADGPTKNAKNNYEDVKICTFESICLLILPLLRFFDVIDWDNIVLVLIQVFGGIVICTFLCSCFSE